jgi:hypothetical protein
MDDKTGWIFEEMDDLSSSLSNLMKGYEKLHGYDNIQNVGTN